MSRRPQRTRPDSSSAMGRPALVPNVESVTVQQRPPESVTPGVQESDSAGLPKYQTMVRKEARLRSDQVDALAQLRRRVARGRASRTEPITDNTLLRVAVDLLLAHADQLAGDTEDELRASLTR